MAGAPAAAATTPSPFPLPPPTPSTPHPSPYSLPSSFPPRARRTNHLRQKILKTLENKPYSDPSNPQFPLQTHPIPIEQTTQQPPVESDQFSLSQGAGFLDSIWGTFSTKSFAKIGLYLVGAFIFQTVCAVIIFGSSDLDDKDENLDSFDHKKDKKLKSELNSLSSGNRSYVETKEGVIGLVDGSEMDNRIMEIQEMARRAREQEKIEARRNGVVEEESDEIDYDSVDETVKKEVDERLMRLKRSLEGGYRKPPPKVLNVGDDSLVFKKKYKYKSPSVDLGDKPKGFGGTKDVDVSNGAVKSGVMVDDGVVRTDEKNDGGTLSDDVGSGSEVSVSKGGNEEQEPKATRIESVAGTTKEPKYDNQTSKAEKPGKSSKVETRKPRGLGKESSDTTITTKIEDVNKNGNLKSKKGGNRKTARKPEDKSITQTNFWWTSLPYVMAVAMESSVNGEESSGLFTLRNPSGLSHTVAFEDRSDATNFSYLLESFFEDLQDFSTSIIPIPTNELEKEVKSQVMKVVVVKKGQLKLYVGQPLEDVESALRALIEQQGDG